MTFQAQLLYGKEETAVRVYSPWLPRAADSVRFSLDYVWGSTAKLEIEVYHKNVEDMGDGFLKDGLISRTAPGRSTQEWSGLEELVRFRFTLTTTLGTSVPRVLFRMLSPCWFDTVKSS